jgi:hypothetical protein
MEPAGALTSVSSLVKPKLAMLLRMENQLEDKNMKHHHPVRQTTSLKTSYTTKKIYARPRSYVDRSSTCPKVRPINIVGMRT